MPNDQDRSSFRDRLLSRATLVGTFVKLTVSSSVEIVAASGLDFAVIDQEHGNFDRASIDAALLAAMAGRTAGLVRVPRPVEEYVAPALDSGAAGILAPHISNAEQARAFVALCRYRHGSRGFSLGTRAAGYGARKMWDHVDRSDARIATVAMIEDPGAVQSIEPIVAVDGLDAVFIGRADLTVALGAPGKEAPVVAAAVERILEAAGTARKPVVVMIDGFQEVEYFRQRGASGFIYASDQGLLAKSYRDVARQFSLLTGAPGRTQAAG
jgi:2-keto-3-deoxy-L-rhamnonate aldolase RhmA